MFAHLAIERSVINRRMVERIRGMHNVIFHDLLEQYPDFFIDVAEEQRLLTAADLIVFQHPVYWYGCPAILKHWQDMVLTNGFAYGPNGTALHGKDFMLAISTGAAADAYRPGGVHHFPLEELLRPFEQMARFCGMNYLPPLVLQGGHNLPDVIVRAHADRYRSFLEAYRPQRIPGHSS